MCNIRYKIEGLEELQEPVDLEQVTLDKLQCTPAPPTQCFSSSQSRPK